MQRLEDGDEDRAVPTYEDATQGDGEVSGTPEPGAGSSGVSQESYGWLASLEEDNREKGFRLLHQ